MLVTQLQKKLEETEHVLSDLEEKHRQANAIIKEKEFLIVNLLKSGEQRVISSFSRKFSQSFVSSLSVQNRNVENAYGNIFRV